jgi:arginine/serine-rich splicing factor 4/5/6
VGNLDPYTTTEEVRELFEGKGDIRRVDMKQGYAFVFLENGHHRAVRELDGSLHGRKRLRVELARGDGLIKKFVPQHCRTILHDLTSGVYGSRREDERRRDAARRPSETLFVVNFDAISTRARDLEDLFSPYGRIVRVRLLLLLLPSFLPNHKC